MSKTRWVVGSNMPGYMPDNEPYLADSYDHAIECMIGDLAGDDRDLDFDECGSGKGVNERQSLQEEYEEAITNLELHLEHVKKGEESPQEQGITIGDRHYFVSIAVD